MQVGEIINLIKSNGVENEVMEILVKDRVKRLKQLENECSNLRANIYCINKINKGKDEAIDALCKPETERERTKKYRALGIL